MTDAFPRSAEFDAPVIELQKFDDKLLVKLENGDLFISEDGVIYRPFKFKVTRKRAIIHA